MESPSQMAKRQRLSNKLFLYVGFLALLLLPLVSPQAKVFNAETFTLDNGFQVVLIPKKTAPALTSMIWYKVGAADEPQGQSGMAHYFEHLMFKGTKDIAPGEMSRIVKKFGGNDNAFTGQDYTAYFQTIAPQYLEKMLTLEADRMVNLAPPAEHFASEKKVVLEERRQRTENDPSGLFTEQMLSALYINHPYGTPIIGWMSEIKDYEWADVKKFYDKFYAPNNAILIISGNITRQDIDPMVTKIFGSLAPKNIPSRLRTEVQPSNGETLMTLKHDTIHEPSFQNVRLAPSSAVNKADSLALQVLQEIMSGGATTRLYKNLVVEQKKAISVGLSYDSSALNDSTIWISGTPGAGVTLDELEHLVMAQIDDVIQNGVREQEMSEAIGRMQDAAIFARDSVSGPAMIMGQALTTGSTIDDVENWPEDIAKVTAAQVQAAAAKYLDDKNPWIRVSITGYLRPLDKETEGAP